MAPGPFQITPPTLPPNAPKQLLPDPLDFSDYQHLTGVSQCFLHTFPAHPPSGPTTATQPCAASVPTDSPNRELASARQRKALLTSQQLNRILDHYGHQDPFVDFDAHDASDLDQAQQYSLEEEVQISGQEADLGASDVNDDPFLSDTPLVDSTEYDAVRANTSAVPLDFADGANSGGQENYAEHGIDPFQLAPYPLPLHPDAARAILHVPMAKVPEYSLLQLNTRINGRIMKEFPDPGQPLPRSATLLDILQRYMNHLWYEGMDAFIQIRAAAVDLIPFIPKRNWVLLRRYGIWNGEDPRNWLQKRLSERKNILGQAYVDALRKAPRIREPGAAFGNSARDRALKAVTPSRSLMNVHASVSSSKRRSATVVAKTRTTPAKPPASLTDGTYINAYQSANLPPLTQLRQNSLQQTTSSSRELEQTSLLPEFRHVDPLTFAMNFGRTPMPDFQSFFSEHVSARSSPENPLGAFLFLSFWDTPQEYLHAKKQFTDGTHECMRLAGKLIAADPVLRAVDRQQQLESMLLLIGQDIFTRGQEFLTRCAALMEGVSSAEGLRHTFNIALSEVAPFCLSDAIDNASYSFLVEHVGENAYRQPELFTYDLLAQTRAAAIASVTQNQERVQIMLRQWQQMQTANPTGFKLQNLISAAVGPTTSVVH
ncbi:hypothetical protein PV04_10227 [Phialophora macrospora]|uniref:Uncharacterized protein n=1 Tax=Phialophora macrospora TaxID=1851006 RepID=A0A0D2F629_9EURO|nr:hypothetical protein PV04_10227 [Phialophora macrospora]